MCWPAFLILAENSNGFGLTSSMTAVRPVRWLETRYTPVCSTYSCPMMMFWIAVLTCKLAHRASGRTPLAAWLDRSHHKACKRTSTLCHE